LELKLIEPELDILRIAEILLLPWLEEARSGLPSPSMSPSPKEVVNDPVANVK
jgi:hypothetical protein